MSAALLLLVLAAAAPAPAQEDGSEASPGLLPLSGFVVFQNSRGPLSYVSDIFRAPPPGSSVQPVRARSCQHGVSIPISLSWNGTRVSGGAGNGGYQVALADLRKKYPDIKGLYDLKVDDHWFSILGIYNRLCTELAGWGWK